MGNKVSPSCWRSSSLESRLAIRARAALSAFWNIRVLSSLVCIPNEHFTLHPCDSDAGDHYPNPVKQKSGLIPCADADTMAWAGEVTQHVGGSFWLSLSQILQGGLKRAVTPSRTPVISSFFPLLVTLEPACPGGTWSRKGPPLCTRRPFRLRHKHFTQDVYKVHGHSERNGNLRVRAEKTGCRWKTMEQSCVQGHSHACGIGPEGLSLLAPDPMSLKQQGQPHSQEQSPQIIPLLPMPYTPPPPIKPTSIKV